MKLTTKQFIERSQRTHGTRYVYSQSVYSGALAKVQIICTEHGAFEQRAYDHMNGSGCQKCVFGERSISYSLTTEQWITKARGVHGDLYDYTRTSYSGNRNDVIITCRDHGLYNQRASSHLEGQGCPRCHFDKLSREMTKTLEGFLSEARRLHGEIYDYSLVNYVRSTRKILIICKKHGSFEQTANSHLQGSGCPSCRYRTSRPAKEWLSSLTIPRLIIEFRLPTGRFADGFDPNTNTVYLFHGDYWHGNPTVYSPDDFNKRAKKTFGELYQATTDYENCIRWAGYNLVVMWERDWINLRKQASLDDHQRASR